MIFIVKNKITKKKVLVIGIVSLLLASCGGGSSSSGPTNLPIKKTPSYWEEIKPVVLPEPEKEEVPKPVVLPEPGKEEVPKPVVLPEPEKEEVPKPVVLPEPEKEEVPKPVVLPEPEKEETPKPVVLPEPEKEEIPKPVVLPEPEKEEIPKPVVLPESKKNINENELSIEAVLKKQKEISTEIPKDTKISNGSTQKIAILDSNFTTNRYKLEQKYSGIEIVETGMGNRSEHGEQVLSTVMEENVNFKPIVASIGKIGTDGGIELPSKELYQQVLARFGEQKIKVFNQSFGIVNEMNEYKSDMSLKDYRAALGKSIYLNQAIKEGEDLVNFYEQQVKDNTIFVWANGNTKKNSYGYEILPINAFLNAGLPKFRPDLEKGWISAIGIDGKNNYGSKNIHYLQHLAYPGEAAYWSISANGTIKYREGNYIYTAIGSSYAAPRVSRAATLVAEKYPWMSNDQIRQTLFTTTDETEVSNNSEVNRSTRYEPDTKYGWGMLNTERALRGPGAFINILSQYKNSPGANNVFTANISEEYTSYFENNIYGDGGLEKLGKGILHLTGNNTYQKGSKITEGQLHIHQVHAGSIEVKPKGTLVLHERAIVGYNSNSAFLTRNEITATDVSNDRKVHNEGKTKIIGSTAIIGGDYIASPGSITELDLSSKIKVVGNIKIDGDVKITSTEYSTASEKKVLMEGKESFGNISDISIDGMREVKGTLENGVLTAEITRKNTAEYLGNVGESSKNVAENIENIFNDLDNKIKSGTITVAELEMGANIQKMEAETLSLATERMSGEIYASSQALNFSQSQNINRDLSNRINGINNLKLKNGEIQTWVSGIGSNGKLKKDGYATADTSIVGGQFGIDKKLNGTTNFGIAMAYSYGKADFNRYAGKAKSDMVGVSLYGNKDLQNKLYLAGRLGISHISTKVERELMTANSDIIKGKIKYDSTMTSVYLEMGKKFEKIIPFIGYSADYLRRGNFSESSAAWGIHSSSQNYWNQNILFGLKSKLDFKNFSLNGHITHEINLGERDLNYEGHFSGNSVKQKFYGIKQPKNKTWIGVGMFKEITQNFGIYGNIDFRFEEGKKADSIYSAGLQYKF